MKKCINMCTFLRPIAARCGSSQHIPFHRTSAVGRPRARNFLGHRPAATPPANQKAGAPFPRIHTGPLGKTGRAPALFLNHETLTAGTRASGGKTTCPSRSDRSPRVFSCIQYLLNPCPCPGIRRNCAPASPSGERPPLQSSAAARTSSYGRS